MSNRWMVVALGVALLGTTVACDDEDSVRENPLGRYVISIFESRDTCDDDRNAVEAAMVLREAGTGLSVEFGGFPAIPATVDSEGELSAQGVVVDNEDGTTTLELENVAFFLGGSVEGEGELQFNGTFPDPEVVGECVQQFTFNGEKASASAAPILPTAPR